MTIGARNSGAGRLLNVESEIQSGDGHAEVELSQREGLINADLTLGANVGSACALMANHGLSSNGMMLAGSGFIVDHETWLGWGRPHVVKPFRNGKDLMARPRGVLVIDLFGLSEDEVRKQYPAIYQHVLTHVKPERELNRRKKFRDRWWVFGEPRAKFRPALEGLSYYVATPHIAKHRVYQIVEAGIAPDHMVIAFALSDPAHLGVLSSRVHSVWALAAGGTLEDRPIYYKSRCFDPFPFPACTQDQHARIRDLGEQLDAHRKARLAEHPTLTMTAMYNVLEKLRAGQEFTKKERTIHEQGLISILRQLHDELDAAVFDAYGWPHDLTDEQILERLVSLNAERAEEEKNGTVRWLRPEFQNPEGE
jgi:hypothetical protein